MLSEEKPYSNIDKIEEFLTNLLKGENLPLEIVLISSWRSILNAISKDQITHEQGRDLVKWLFK